MTGGQIPDWITQVPKYLKGSVVFSKAKRPFRKKTNPDTTFPGAMVTLAPQSPKTQFQNRKVDAALWARLTRKYRVKIEEKLESRIGR